MNTLNVAAGAMRQALATAKRNRWMPEVGDIARGHDIGKRDGTIYIYVDCMDCREGRWIPRHRARLGVERCFPCNLVYQKATTLKKLYIKHPR